MLHLRQAGSLAAQPAGLCPTAVKCPSASPFATASRQAAALRPLRAASDSASGSSRSVLDAFFYGKAFAELVNERLGAAADDFLVEFNKKDAERRHAVREFFDQVQSRAEAQMIQSSATSSPGTEAGRIPPSRQLPAGGRINGATAVQPVQESPADLQEIADDLRAEVASTRAQIVALRNKQQQKR